MRTRSTAIICLLFIFLLSLTACREQAPLDSALQDKPASLSAVSMGSGDKTFVFEVYDADGKKTVFNIFTDKTIVGDALSELGLISGDDGPYGLYVKTVNSLTYDYDKDGKYWAFYINGEYATSGIDTTEISKDNVYSFRVE